ncbi:uncharacterized protein LY79DRAFT_550179 [Colletotrichum navitas]|uniref:Uncharacterized protein n=1 Tax=Colletotrichum navitas TaxID=681940 RepID=A0AAD8Q1N4_9PEZI|nr:uncharacterized protein LY79DRAFT_550179 [Colletotrichum navitas]KAK1594217.1 hypothetical protein LY79DRAFT_550179 [Colletotrichum navitas]
MYVQRMFATTQWLQGSWPEQCALVLRQLSHLRILPWLDGDMASAFCPPDGG